MVAPLTTVVLGASSQVGIFLLPRLIESGEVVIAVSRRVPAGTIIKRSDVRWIQSYNDLPLALEGDAGGSVSQLVSCGPIKLALEWLEQLPELQRCVVTSTTSVVTKDNEQVRQIAQSESVLRARCLHRQAIAVILRPTLIYGCGMDRNISVLAGLASRTGLIPVSTSARGLRQPVHADDLAAVCSAAVRTPLSESFLGPVCGGSTLPFHEMAERIADSVERKSRVVAIPPVLFRPLLKMLALHSKWRHLDPEMIDRQAQDLVFDDRETQLLLGVRCRSFNPSAKDFEVPSRCARFQLAGMC